MIYDGQFAVNETGFRKHLTDSSRSTPTEESTFCFERFECQATLVRSQPLMP